MSQNNITPEQKTDTVSLGGMMKHMNKVMQRYTREMIGIPNQSEAVYYTQQEADAYNAELTGALNSTDPLTAEEAAAYNEAVTGASKEAGDTLSSAEAAAYNATLEGAVSTSDIKTPAVPKKVKDYVDDGLSGKADKLPMTGEGAAHENNFMAIDANGNIKDSGKNENSFLTQHQQIKTINSASIVGSGNVDLQVPITDLKQIGCAYVTCATASATAAKTATLTGFELRTNCIVSVLFTYGFTTSNSTLEINGTGAKPIYYHGYAVAPLEILSNTVAILQYSDNKWHIVSKEVIARNYGDDFVDLGLPSGTLWCKHNVGATNPEDFGLYFSWGNIDGHAEGSGYSFSSANYDNSTGATITGYIAVSDKYDAARAHMGAPWRMPSSGECTELYSNCLLEGTTLNGVDGVKLTSVINGNSIFFPAGGQWVNTSMGSKGTISYTWTRENMHPTTGNFMRLYTNGGANQTFTNKYIGMSVRAVQ